MATYSYPRTIASIPYASFLTIKKFEYNNGLKNATAAAKVGTQGRIANYNSSVGSVIGGVANALFGQTSDGTNPSIASSLNLTQAQKQALSGNRNNRRGAALGTPIQAPKTLGELTEEQWKKIADSGGVKVTNINGTETTITDYKEIKALTEAKSLSEQNSNVEELDIVLPNEMSFSYGAEWSNTFKLGTLALLAGNVLQGAGQIAATSAIGAAGAALGSLFNQGQQGTQQTPRQQAGIAALGGAAAGLDPFKINSQLGPSGQGLTNAVGLAGLAPNENAVQFFQRMQNREFNFTFEMFAPESGTAEEIQKIINDFFKKGMHPIDKVGLLAFPDVYEIAPKFVNAQGTAGPHKLLPKSKLCALTNLRVNASPSNFFQTTYEGYIPIVICEVTFKEITALTRQDLEVGL